MLSPRPRSTVADLLRLAVTWLVIVLLVQGLAAAQALGQGPLHRHHAPPAGVAAPAVPHAHAAAERHAHALPDAGVVSVADALADDAAAALDPVAFALTAALALMLAGLGVRVSTEPRRHVWRTAPSWAWRTAVPAGPRRPPRRG